MNQKSILFDLFHTLVDVGSAPGTPGRYTADILGVSREAWHHACFSDAHDIVSPTEHRQVLKRIAHSIDPTISDALIEEAVTERAERFRYTLLNVDEDVLATLEALVRRGYRLALVSNASSGEVEAWSESPLARFFTEAIFSCECGHKKPQAAIYHAALEGVQGTVADAVFVGDGGSNEHEGAKALGLINILTTQFIRHRIADDHLQQRRQHVSHEIAHLRELPDLLNAIGHH